MVPCLEERKDLFESVGIHLAFYQAVDGTFVTRGTHGSAGEYKLTVFCFYKFTVKCFEFVFKRSFILFSVSFDTGIGRSLRDT